MIKHMVDKDYNHACVILYSVGNEIQEIGTERGAEINRMLCNAFKELDATRFTTNGMNALNAAGAKVYPVMQELAPLIRKDAGEAGTNDNSGSNAINSFMKLMEGEAGDAFAVHPIVTEVLEESSESMDIIGFNYLTGRHLLEGELHPNKCVLGTETFPADIARLWKVVNSSKRVLGDFTWTGYDYLGEAGCGIFITMERATLEATTRTEPRISGISISPVTGDRSVFSGKSCMVCGKNLTLQWNAWINMERNAQRHRGC